MRRALRSWSGAQDPALVDLRQALGIAAREARQLEPEEGAHVVRRLRQDPPQRRSFPRVRVVTGAFEVRELP
jgi:hypothetical protein